MKKLFLLLGVICSGFDLNAHADVSTGFWIPLGKIEIVQNISENLVLVAMTTAILAGVTYQISWHQTYADKAAIFVSKLEHALQERLKDNQKTLDVESMLEVFTDKEVRDMVQYFHWVNNSYNQWLLFWNWTPSQKKAYSQLATAMLGVFYLGLIDLYMSVEDASNLERMKQFKCHLRKYFTSVSIYPLVYAHDQMVQLSAMAASIDNVSAAVKTLLSSVVMFLNPIIDELSSDAEYIQELQTQRTHTLLAQNNHNINRSLCL